MPITQPPRMTFRLRSIFFKATAITAVTVAVVDAVLAWRSSVDTNALLGTALTRDRKSTRLNSSHH